MSGPVLDPDEPDPVNCPGCGHPINGHLWPTLTPGKGACFYNEGDVTVREYTCVCPLSPNDIVHALLGDEARDRLTAWLAEHLTFDAFSTPSDDVLADLILSSIRGNDG